MLTMAEQHSHQFASSMAQVAETLLGVPNARLSRETQVRYGTNGSMDVDLTTGTFYDHEAKQGGGVLDLISKMTGRDHRGAVEWMHEHGYIDSDRQPLKSKPAPLGREVVTYDYVDENDELLFQVVRFEPKTFRQRRRDEIGAWSWSVKGVRQVPYRLPDLIDAVAMERTVYIVEGEKDVDNLRKLGLAATCNAGGAGKWRSELDEYFRGATVAILPDHDPQSTNPDGSLRFHPDGRPVFTGQDHALDVAKHLHGIAAHVRVIDLAKYWPEMPKKGDVTDWIDHGGTADELQALTDLIVDWAPGAFVSKWSRWEDIVSAPTGMVGYSWYVEDIIPLGEISLVFGDTGSGKSFSMLDMAMAGARGIKWNGYNVEQGLVVYVAAEAGKGFAKRMIAYAIQNKLTDPLPFALWTKRPDFFHDDKDVSELIKDINEDILPKYNSPLILIVIDTLSALAPGMNENASQDVSMVRRRLVMLQDAFKTAAIVLVHHKPKGGSTPRGHSSLSADFETTIEYETVTDKRTEGGKTIHRATVRKQREGKKGLTWEFTLPALVVGKNKWDHDETSCVVEPYGGKKPEVGFHATPTELLFVRALFDALVDHGRAPPAGLPVTITKVVDITHVRALMRERTIPAHEDNDAADNRFRVAFKRAGDKLRDGAVIGVQGAVLWYTGKLVRGMDGGQVTWG